MAATRTNETSLPNKLSLPLWLVADPRAASHPMPCGSSHPHAPSAPSLVCRPGLGQNQMERGCQEGGGTVPRSSRTGTSECEGPLADHSQTVHQGLPAHLRLRLSLKPRVHVQNQGAIFSPAQGEAEVWGNTTPATSPRLFLAQHSPAQEGNVCISIQMLVVWSLPFTV